ncbi:MAG: hypothetical protein ACOC1O_04380 [bacterium]
MKNTKKWLLFLTFILILFNTNIIFADTTATQDVSITVEPINEISVSSGTIDLVINADNASVSDGIYSVSDSNTTLSYTTNESGKKISAELDSKFTNIALKIDVTPNENTSVSTDEIILSTIANDIITGIDNSSDNEMIITYTAEVQSDVTPDESGESNTVTFTLTDS